MASIITHKGSLIYCLKHDLREREHYRNREIDQSRSNLNYTIIPEAASSIEINKQFEQLLSSVYHRGGRTSLASEFCIQLPDDLAPEKEGTFFEAITRYCIEKMFDGDASRILLAVVHRDESTPHMHLIFTYPEVENEKYMPLRSKLDAGIIKIEEKYDINFTPIKRESLVQILSEYEERSDDCRERDAIHAVSELLDVKRDDARWMLTRIRRLDKERLQTKLMAKDEFLTREFFRDFHPSLQSWINEHGPACTVYKGGHGFGFSVEQLKEIKSKTGITVKDLEKVQEITGYTFVNTAKYDQQLQQLHEIKKELEITKTNSWSNFGWERKETISW